MNKEKIFDIRFLVPPSLVVFLVFLFSPSTFLEILRSSYLTQNTWIDGTVTITGLLAIGFLISSLTYFYVRMCKNIINPDCASFHKELFELDDFGDKTNIPALELGSWMTLDRIDFKAKNNDHIIGQVHKRWSMAMANFNCSLAVLLSFFSIVLLIVFNKIPFNTLSIYQVLYFLFLLLLFKLFWNNGLNAHESVLQIDLLLAKYINKTEK